MTCIAPADIGLRGMIRTKDMAQGDVRTKMVKGAAGLLATKGVEGTSFAEVLAVTDAPRGSIYHHFPGGKSELVHAALDLVSSAGAGGHGVKAGQFGGGDRRTIPGSVASALGLFRVDRGLCRRRRHRGWLRPSSSSTTPGRSFETGPSIWPDYWSRGEWPRPLLSNSLS